MPKNTAAGPKRFWKSFGYAAQGILLAFRNELNMRVHCGVAVFVVLLAAWFRVSAADWLILLLAITLVLGAELINTAIESVVDLVSPDIHPLAKAAKDTAAGAVLLAAVFAVISGVYVFYHPVMDWIADFVS